MGGNRPGALARAARLLRPAEWVLLGFALWLVSKGGLAALPAIRHVLQLRTLHLLVALSIVGCIELAIVYRATPWPAGPDVVRQRRMLWLTFPLAILPLALALASSDLVRTLYLPGYPLGAMVVKILTGTLLSLLGFGVPGLVLWLWAGLSLKTRQRPGALEAGGALLDLLRDWLPILVLISGYAWAGAVIQDAPRTERDDWMRAADRFLFLGVDPVHALERFVWQPLSEWLAFSYTFYGVMYPLCLGAVHLLGRPGAFRQVIFALSLAIAIAFTSYTLLPVEGPLLTEHFDVPIHLSLTGQVKQTLMDDPRITWDCFPSMHTCATLLFAWGTFRHARRVFWVIAPMAISMPLACVYLRYHYVVDVIAGALLAAICAWVAERVEPVLASPPQTLRTNGASGR